MSAHESIHLANASLEIKSLRDVTVGKLTIDEFRMMNTKFGRRLAAIVGNDLIFLPSKYAKNIENQSQVDELNTVQYILNKKHPQANGFYPIEVVPADVVDKEEETANDDDKNK